MQSGRQREAWDRMQELSENEPDYYFAHYQLAFWAYNTEAWPQLKKASQRMVALRPDDSESWGHLGQAEEELDNPTAAIAAYTRSLRIDPAYLYAARRKATLQTKAGQLEEAEATLKGSQHHHQDAFLVADLLAVELQRSQGNITDPVRHQYEEISVLAADLEQDPYYHLDSIFAEAGMIAAYEVLLSEKARTMAFRSPAEARA